MIKKTIIALGLFIIVGLAYFSAEKKKLSIHPLLKIQVGMNENSLQFLGPAISSNNREKIYWLDNGATFLVTLFEGKITGAWLNFTSPVEIQQTWTQNLKFVQMTIDSEQDPSWFFAGNPNEGKVFKINTFGLIESITWVKPFESHQQSKNLQALYNDFTSQQSLSL